MLPGLFSRATLRTIIATITGTVGIDQVTAGANHVEVNPAATIVHGQTTVAVAGTEVALGGATALTAGVRVKALHANTGWVYVGANPVTSATGYVLDAGEEVFIEVNLLSTVYIDVSVNNEGVSYIGS